MGTLELVVILGAVHVDPLEVEEGGGEVRRFHPLPIEQGLPDVIVLGVHHEYPHPAL